MKILLKDFPKICRICMEFNNLKSLLNLEYETINLLKSLAGIELPESDVLPKNICESCKVYLEDVAKFVDKVKANNSILKSISQGLNGSILVGGESDSNINESCQSEDLKVDGSDKVIPSVWGVVKFDKIDDQKCNFIACPVCKRTVHKDGFSRHYRFNSKCRPADCRCQICNISFYPKQKLAIHLRSHRTQAYQCPKCSKTFAFAENLRMHALTHQGVKPFICKLCDKGFLRKRSLDEHTNSHTGKTPYICVYCGKSFTRLAHHAAHVYHLHNMNIASIPKLKRKYTEKRVHLSIPCKTCGKVFASRSGYNNHQLIHKGSKRFLCNVCGKSFITNPTLLIHMRTHSGAKPFECKECGRCFRQRYSLHCHMLREKHDTDDLLNLPHCDKCYHPKSTLEIQTSMQASTTEHPNCLHCSKVFRNTNSKNNHISKHSRERSHKCSLCPKSFTSSSHLSVHLRTHSGEKPYPCPECGKLLAQPQTLKVHMRQHSGETPFVCSVCSKGYRDSSNLKRHFKRHHKEKDTPVKSDETDKGG